MNVALFVGARPEYIKTWSVYQALVRHGVQASVVATGQHQDILRQQQAILPMPIDHWLLREQPSLSLATLYGVIYNAACYYFATHNPGAVFVNGDTSSALAVATAAFHHQIPVAHIEAGLRSDNLKSPFPEEFNRIAIDALGTWLFAPTEAAAQITMGVNLNAKVAITGNTVIDALKAVLPKVRRYDAFVPYALLDIHRRETHANSIERIVEVVMEQARIHQLQVVWPAHPNPEIQAIAKRWADYDSALIWLPPQNYLSFVGLMLGAQLILTDSGGVVEEAITIGTPTLQLRDHTDRQEAIDHQCSWLATTRPEEVERLLKIALPYAPCWKARMTNVQNPYGNGDAGEQSVAFFLREFNDVK